MSAMAPLQWLLLAPGLLMPAGSAAGPAADAMETMVPMAIGSPLSALDRDVHECRARQGRLVCQVRGGALQFHGSAALAMTLEYEAELLRKVTVLFDEARFEDVLRQLQADLGAGTTHDEKIRAGMSGVMVNRIRAWRRRDEVRMLEQYSGKYAVSALRVFSAADFDAEMNRRAAERVRGLRDL